MCQITVYRSVASLHTPKPPSDEGGGAKPRRERKTCVFALVPIEMQRFTVTTPQSATLTAPLTRGAFGPYHTFGRFDKREFEDRA